MKTITFRASVLVALLVSAMALSACSSDRVIDNTVGVAAGATKFAAKGAVGAGKLVYRGGKAVVGSNE